MIDRQVNINQVSSYVINLFNIHQDQCPFLIYHNLAHTQKVVSRTIEIAAFYKLDKTDNYIVTCAAWFHDCGHLFGPAAGHELRSVSKMKEFMESLQTNDHVIRNIEWCILATRLPSNPKTLLEEILCDADLYHLGTEEFCVADILVKKEYQLRNNLSPTNWDEGSLTLLKTHRFYTQYCRDLLDKGKLANIRFLEKKISGE